MSDLLELAQPVIDAFNAIPPGQKTITIFSVLCLYVMILCVFRAIHCIVCTDEADIRYTMLMSLMFLILLFNY